LLRLVIGFLPWIILGVLGNRWFVLALSLSLAAAAVTTVRQIRGRSLKILDTTAFAFFLFVLVGVFGFHWMILATYMSLLVNVTLTAIAWGSLLAGTPFTIQYAREQVASEFWHSPLFIRTNQYITAVWASTSSSRRSFRSSGKCQVIKASHRNTRGFFFRWARHSFHGLFPALVPGPHAAPPGGGRATVTTSRRSDIANNDGNRL
jgi:hypothetical protein